MKGFRRAAAPLLVALVLGVCGPQSGGAPSAGELSQSAASGPSRTLNIVMRVEPPDILEGAVDRRTVHKCHLGRLSLALK